MCCWRVQSGVGVLQRHLLFGNSPAHMQTDRLSCVLPKTSCALTSHQELSMFEPRAEDLQSMTDLAKKGADLQTLPEYADEALMIDQSTEGMHIPAPSCQVHLLSSSQDHAWGTACQQRKNNCTDYFRSKHARLYQGCRTPPLH